MGDRQKDKKTGAPRKLVQAGWAILTNSYVKGFIPGDPAIYGGPLKQACVPGLNCHSCPGALGTCPVGAIQNMLDGHRRSFPFYVIGYLAIIGIIAGRTICGWLCPFGLIQELLYKIPVHKIGIPDGPDRVLRYLKYLILAVMVFALPFFYRSGLGTGEPFFCEYICPAGTLEAGVPLIIANSALRGALGWLFAWKFMLLLACIAASMVIYRPFCKYICPLGAIYGILQKVGLIRMNVDRNGCTDCGRCASVCRMGVDPHTTPNSSECIRCRDCITACPVRALSMGMGAGKGEEERIEST